MPLPSPSSPFACLLLGASFALAGCRCASSADDSTQGPNLLSPPATAPTPTALGAAATGTQPRTLLEWSETAYHTKLAFDGDALVLLTTKHLIRLTDRQPSAHWALPLDSRAAFFGDDVVYWDAGAVWIVGQTGGDQKRLGPLADAPQQFLGSERGFVWIESAASGGSLVRHFRGATAHTLYETQASIVASTMRDDRIYLVETTPQGWQLTGFSLDGTKLPPTTPRSTRTPAMLVAADGGVYYYDGPSSTVRRVGLGLGQETTLAEQVICSPLTVSIRVFCAQVGGLYEIPFDRREPRTLVSETGLVTSLTADEERLAWVVDVAAEKLAVRTLRLR